MSGNIGEGIQYELIFDLSTFTTGVKRNHVVKYTGVDITCETHDSSALQSSYAYATAMAFAGLTFIDFPYVEMSAALPEPYDGQDMSVPYGGASGRSSPGAAVAVSTSDMVTVLHRCRTFAIAYEDITAGTPIMMADGADGSTFAHDGMTSPSDNSTQVEIDCAFGIAETNATAAGSHDTHSTTWSQDLGEFVAEHPKYWISLWK